MKLGLIADIHESVELLQAALSSLRNEHRVDQIVVLGDLFSVGRQIGETCRLLNDAGVIGVWGNHDFGLAYEPTDEVRAKYAGGVLDCMTALKPRLEIEGCLFTHVEPWLNAEDVADLWYFEGPPDTRAKLDRIFTATSQRIMFGGHFHRWLLASPEEVTPWNGKAPVRLDRGRWFVVINALFEGSFAVFDTSTSWLTPCNLTRVHRSVDVEE